MINITAAKREDMESSLEELVKRCVEAYKNKVFGKLQAGGMWERWAIKDIMDDCEQELHRSLKIEVAGADRELNEIIDGTTASH